MALHTQGTGLYRSSAARTPRHPTGQGRSEVRPQQLCKRMRTLQPQAGGQSTSTTARAKARVLMVIDHAFDLLPALLLIALLVAGSGLFVVTFDYS
jgi:hypothetical protein